MLLVEEYRQIGNQVPLGLARQATDELLENQDGEGDSVPELPPVATAAENDAALANLMAQMGGIGG